MTTIEGGSSEFIILHFNPFPMSRFKVLKTVDLKGLIEHWKNDGFKKIVTMVGAGISTCKFYQHSQNGSL